MFYKSPTLIDHKLYKK